MADGLEQSLRRTSSHASDISSKSSKVKTVRTRPKTSLSNTSSTSTQDPDPSLTSFPSLSPNNKSKPLAEQAPAKATPPPNRTVSQKVRERKATLAGLTSGSPLIQGRDSLFDDSPRPSIEVPGALHLANDDHIERLIARSGAVKLVRQFARDLARRDAEISSLRIRADDRERELKKMLREADVSHQEIEQRLHELDMVSRGDGQDQSGATESRPGASRKVTNSIDDMMQEAMHEEVGTEDTEHNGNSNYADMGATIRPIRPDHDGSSSLISTRKRAGSTKGWQDYLWGNGDNSRKTSRSSSIFSEDIPEDPDARVAASSGANRRKGLDKFFQSQPISSSASYFIGGTKKPVRKPIPSDNASITSKKSERSTASWTVKLFAGNPQAAKDNEDNPSRDRSSSLDQRPSETGWRSTPGTAGSGAFASLLKVNTLPAPISASKLAQSKKPNQEPPKRGLPAGSQSTTTPDTVRSDQSITNLGPVEMEAILPDETKPPTMSSTNAYAEYVPGNLLTDRFGFIYDQRQRKRQREAALAVKRSNRASAVDSLKGIHLDPAVDSGGRGHERKNSNSMLSPSPRPGSPLSLDEQQQEAAPTKGWQDYLRITSRPTELLSHTPSSAAIVSLTVADSTSAPDKERSRASSISVDHGTASMPTINQNPEPSASPVVVTSTDFSATANGSNTPTTTAHNTDQEPVKLLLEQLTELHDSLQTERTVKWNEFLRKVRAERGAAAAAAAAERQSGKGKMTANMPEASLIDGEFIGVTNLGNKGKIGRNKWKEFKILVLGGVPVSLRSKIWSECSGASALRIPGYYDDLVAASNNTSDQLPNDAEVAAQIQADIHRTLTDNVFFRHGPGTTKLRDVLLAYARRNPVVGYCQGMNMITASLLLIMPTAEDAFWILVAMIENILPAHYYDHGLVTSRADQIVLREYVSEVLPRLSTHLEELSVELEAMTFQWFLSVFTDCLSAEALYRVWDVVLCLNSTSSASPTSPTSAEPQTNKAEMKDEDDNAGTGSTFLFQLALALLKLNEAQLLACDNPASVYGYINHNMTNHAISIDGLIQASEGLRKVVVREDVLLKRAKAIQEMGGR